jgi:SAM-dependent methyltransferase
MSLGNQFEYWNSVAEIKTFTHPLNLPLFSRYVGKTASIIDYGCGYGRLVKQLLENGYGNTVGYDTSGLLIERGKRDFDIPIHPIKHPGDLPTNPADCILLFAVLTCIPPNRSQKELINILSSRLKQGGFIYISDYYLQENSEEMERYQFLNGDRNNYGTFTLAEGVTFRHHTREWISLLFKDFKLITEVEIDVRTMNGHKAKAFQMIVQKHTNE